MKKPTTGGRYTRNKKTGAVLLDVDHTPSALTVQQAHEAAEAEAQVETSTTDTAEAEQPDTKKEA